MRILLSCLVKLISTQPSVVVLKTENFAKVFTNLLYTAVNSSKRHKQCSRRDRLPKYIVEMLRKKKRAYVDAEQTHNYTNFEKISRSVSAAIRQHRCKESRLIFARDQKSFSSYIYKKSNSHHDLSKSVNDVILSDADAAIALLQEFDNNFSHSNPLINNCQINSLISASSDLRFNCTQNMVARVICDCPNTSCSPDRVSYRQLKFIKNIIKQKLIR